MWQVYGVEEVQISHNVFLLHNSNSYVKVEYRYECSTLTGLL
jgi:hypothetical protein